MNYMTEIKLFNEWLETNELTTSGIALWYALMYVANRSGWRPELCIPVSVLCLRTKLSRSAIYKERAILRDHGLIDFDTGDGRQSSNYRIHGFEARFVSTLMSTSRTQPETQSENQEATGPEASTLVSTTTTQPCTQNEEPPEASTVVSTERTQPETQDGFVSTTRTQPCTIYKHKQDLSSDKEEKDNGGSGEKQKTTPASKKEKVARKRKKDEFDLSFAGDPVWEELLRTWLEYKRGRNQVYKSELSVRKFLTMLRNLSRGDPEMARQIIDKSIASNWAGIFELKDAGGQARGQPATGQRIGQIKQPEDEARRQKLLDKFGGSKK